MKPRIIVLGEKPQGATWLRFLIESDRFDIVAGVPRFGGKKWWGEDDFRGHLERSGIPVVHREELGSFEYDILWSTMYGFIIEAEHINRARLYGLNLHESPLPRYRGCNGYTHAILENDTTYGTTFHFLDAALDAGEIIDQEIFPIAPDETSKELYLRTMEVSNRVFLRNLSRVADGTLSGRPNPIADEPVRPRSSLMDLKEMHLDALNGIDDMYRIARAFDFLPFEPAYFLSGGDKWYAFIEGSALRSAYSTVASVDVSDISAVADKARGGVPFAIDAFARRLVCMPQAMYGAIHPVFTPQYSWIAPKPPVQ